MAVRILITDDHGIMRAGLRALLDGVPDIEVVGEAESGEEALQWIREHRPDIVLLDIGMPGIDGIETTRQIKKIDDHVQVLILSVYEDESLLQEAIKAGASGYIIKRAAEEELLSAIQSVSRGYMYIHPAVTRLLVKGITPTVDSQKEALETLTPRELEIMGYIVQGFTNKRIAETLLISMRTVEGHRASLLNKLGIKNRVGLVAFAEKYGLSWDQSGE